MQYILTASIEVLTIAFIGSMIFDFAARLLNAFKASKPSIPVKVCQPGPALASLVEETIVPQSEPEIEPAPAKIADIAWVKDNLPPAETWALEIPNAIALAKSRLPVCKSQPVVEIATKQQLISAGIRKCKKLASQLKIRHYNVMRLTELADALSGKVAVGDLLA